MLQAHHRRGDWLLWAKVRRRIVTGRRSLHKTEILINSKLLTIVSPSSLKPNPFQEGCRPIIPPGALGNKKYARTFEEWFGISSDQGTIACADSSPAQATTSTSHGGETTGRMRAPTCQHEARGLWRCCRSERTTPGRSLLQFCLGPRIFGLMPQATGLTAIFLCFVGPWAAADPSSGSSTPIRT